MSLTRIPIYPNAEAFIKLKKQYIYEKQQQQEEEEAAAARKGVKWKDTAEEKINKRSAKLARNSRVVTTDVLCKSCGESGHSSARSKQCKNHNYTIQEVIEKKIGLNYQRYTISVPLRSFLPIPDDAFNNTLRKIKSLSMFLRNVMYRAQLFINHYILKYPDGLPNEFFQQNFWYSLCRLINENISIDVFKQKYSSHIPYLEEVWNELSGLEGVSMVVNKEGLTNYGQDLSTACESVATCYNNFYIENFGNVVNSYCIYMIRKEFPDLKMPLIKYIVYNHVLEILFSTPSSTLPENIGSSVDKQTQDKIRNFLNPLILEIKDRLPPAPITKETLNNAPFNIMPVFRHILSKYESIIDANQQITPVVQLTVASQQQPNLLQQAEGSNQPRQRPKKKKKVLKNENPRERNNKDRQFQPPRLFSLFPNPSLKWRFIKIDSQNLQGIFGRRTHQQQEETPFDLTQRSFFECFDFKKLKIKSLVELQSMHEKGRMFLNSFYTDGYTCRVSFCRKRYINSHLDKVTLTLNDFNSERVEQLFRTCTVDPNRKDVFTSYHGANDIRRLSSSEYHNMNGVVNRQKLEQERKKRDNIEHIETRIPSPKTTNAENYKKHIMAHKERFEEGDRKKMPMIVFGNGLQNKSHVKYKGLRRGVTDKLYKQLKLREKSGELLLLDIDEFNTSKICNECFTKNLENLKCDGRKIHQVFNCKNCNIFWNRDVLASKNMFTIATSIWSGNGCPNVFQRQSATSNVVASTHSGESTA
ncbi:hypothetical protein G6F44_007556 [Rhizopus delemar]|nr:hypothetical protein G6F44_007556 [Rhizopus delemar]